MMKPRKAAGSSSSVRRSEPAQRGALRPVVERFLAGREATADEVFAHAQAAGLRHTRGTVLAHLHDGTHGPSPYRRVGPSRFTLTNTTAPSSRSNALDQPRRVRTSRDT